MSVRDRIEGKLARLEELARIYFEHYVESFYDVGVHVDERGQVRLDRPVSDDLDWIRPAMQKRWDGFRGRFDDLTWRFRQFYILDYPPPYFVTMVQRLGGTDVSKVPGGGQDAYNSLHEAWEEHLFRVNSMVDKSLWYDEAGDQETGSYDGWKWQGEAAEEFHTSFLRPFKAVHWARKLYVHELAFAAASLSGVVNATAEDLAWIADSCIDALENGPGGITPTEKTVSSWISFLSGLVSLGTPPPFSAVPGGLSALAGGFSLLPEQREIAKLAEGSDRPKPLLQVIPTDLETILDSTWVSLGKLDQYVHQVDEEIQQGLKRDVDLLYGAAHKGAGPRLERPEVADGDGDSFGIRAAPKGDVPGTPRHEQTIVESVVEVYAAGKVILPRVAELYEDARNAVDECTDQPTLEPLLPRSLAQFREARDDLSWILGNAIHDLKDVGEVLIEVAKDYELTEKENEEALRLIGLVDSGDYDHKDLPLEGYQPSGPD